MSRPILQGSSAPLGATVMNGGVNFSVYSPLASRVELLLFDGPEDAEPSDCFALGANQHKTFYYWHCFVPDAKEGQVYGWRVDGTYDPAVGLRFDGSKLLLDPYARAVAFPSQYDREAARQYGVDTTATSLRGVVVDSSGYDWEGDSRLERPLSEMVIYEMHIGGFTRHPSSQLPPSQRGTYAGLIEKIPYLQSLGITAVELLPVQQYDPYDAPVGLTNYWGYNPVALFAPHHGYSSDPSPLGPLNEFRAMVKALHHAGIEVILDVVFNHTAEGDQTGPTLSLRGFSNRAYYILHQHAPAFYANYSGCGNTLKCNHSIVRRLIMDCLRYWVQELHVDGFRFDLASILARDETGQPLENPPILWEIESDPVLAGTKIIAEAWDAAGLYQVGSFIGNRWAEWNGRFRDDVRAFVRGDAGHVAALAQRLNGSPDLYQRPGRTPERSINFITSHDGFTMNDLVSYNEKHNEANREWNRDGENHNLSWNCGVEGPTNDPDVLALRQRQIKNLMLMLFVAQGTPMMLMGDEVRRTQYGNNNVYCQDNPVSWFDWEDTHREEESLRFLRALVQLRRSTPILHEDRFWMVGAPPDQSWLAWHGVDSGHPDWSFPSRTMAMEIGNDPRGERFYLIANSYWDALAFQLPSLPDGQRWRRVVDTALPPPGDITLDPSARVPISTERYLAHGRSCVLLTTVVRSP